MYLIELKKSKFVQSILVLVIVLSLLKISTKANEIIDENSSEPEYSETLEDEDIASESNAVSIARVSRKQHVRNNTEKLIEAPIKTEKNNFFNDLMSKISLIFLLLLSIFGVSKLFMSRNRFNQLGSFVDEFTQKFALNFTNFSNPNSSSLKLKQTLILTPGQNIYMVEIDGKKLLLGGTHNGGIQFLADLSDAQSMSQMQNSSQLVDNFKPNFSYKPPEESQSSYEINWPAFARGNKDDKQNIPSDIFSQSLPETSLFSPESLNKEFFESTKKDSYKAENMDNGREERESTSNSFQTKQSLRRRTNFRQSLLSGASNGSPNLARMR